ncbi:MAG: hypothetical protein HOH65_22200 [Rhodospirillaceae bacterium]|nr:hypothetical protein [Rhodospirillaceae bacterium]
MNLRDFIKTIADSDVAEWELILQPTYRHRFTPVIGPEGEQLSLETDQHRMSFTYRKDIRISMAYGLIVKGNFVLPISGPLANENARTAILDLFDAGRMVHRETVLLVDRQRCLLPIPKIWSDAGCDIPIPQYNLIKLLHTLAGPPTDFDEYFETAGMRKAGGDWP